MLLPEQTSREIDMPVQFPTDAWRQQKAEETRRFEAGQIQAGERYMNTLFPDAFIDRTEVLLREFVGGIDACGTGAEDFPRVMARIRATVEALNRVNQDFNMRVIETAEREALCEFIDDSIIARSLDIEALAASCNCTRYELTDQWREW
jgi:hypothetical protein